MAATDTDEMLPEYDFNNAVQGKHFRRYRQGYTVTIHKKDGTKEIQDYKPEKDVIILAADVAEMFPTSEAVNEALRFLLRIARENRPAPVEQEVEKNEATVGKPSA